MRGKYFIFLAGLVFASLMYTLPAAAAKFIVSPPRFDITMSPGAGTTEGIEVANHGDSPIELKVYVSDWEMDIKGELNYKKVGVSKNSCSSWIKVNPQYVRLGPQESRLVRFTISAPPSGHAGSYWSVLFFESQPGDKAKRGMGVVLTGRVGVIIYAIIAGTEQRSGKIVDMKVLQEKEAKGGEPRPYKLSLTFENTGNVHYRPKGSWELKNEAGKKLKKGEIEEFLVLPKVERNREIPLNVGAGLPRPLVAEGAAKTEPPTPSDVGTTPLPAGKYTLSVELDYGAKDLVGGDLIFEVPATAALPPAGK